MGLPHFVTCIDKTFIYVLLHPGCLVTPTCLRAWWALAHHMALPWTTCLEWWTRKVDHLILWVQTWPITQVVRCTEMILPSLSLLMWLFHSSINIFILISVLVWLGMVPSPEMNNKMNNKVDGGGTPKTEPKSKVTTQLYVAISVFFTSQMFSIKGSGKFPPWFKFGLSFLFYKTEV